MTYNECAKCLTVLRTTYQSFARQMTLRDAESIINTWTICFKDEPYEVVSMAIFDLIQTKKDFAPDIAAIKERIREITKVATGEPDETELWAILCKAVSNSAYCAKEEFAKLPPVLKKFAGSPNTLFEWSQMEADIFNSVTKGQFNKSIKTLIDREETNARLTSNPKMRELLGAIASKSQLPKEEYSVLMPSEVNSRKSQIVATIDSMERARLAPKVEETQETEKKAEFIPMSEDEFAKRKTEMFKRLA